MLNELSFFCVFLTLITFRMGQILQAKLKTPIFNPILVAVFYGELMGPLSLLGAAIVICGVAGYNVLLAGKRKEAPSPVKNKE